MNGVVLAGLTVGALALASGARSGSFARFAGSSPDRAKWGGSGVYLWDFDGPLEVTRMALDRDGYAKSDGRYYGTGTPLWHVSSPDDEVDYVVRSGDRKAALALVASHYPMARVGGRSPRGSSARVTTQSPRMMVEWRPYRCAVCGNLSSISTNHTGPVYDFCRSCSWKGIGFAPGKQTMMYGGRAYRLHNYVEAGSAARGKIDQSDYAHYVVVEPGTTIKGIGGRSDKAWIESGWSYPEDAAERVRDLGRGRAKVFTRVGLRRRGIDPRDNASWGTG